MILGRFPEWMSTIYSVPVQHLVLFFGGKQNPPEAHIRNASVLPSTFLLVGRRRTWWVPVWLLVLGATP